MRQRLRPQRLITSACLLLLVVTIWRTAPQDDDAASRLSLGRATILGAVEGATEFIPVSSTGHLVITDHLLGGADDPTSRARLDSFLIVVQAGAIAAVGWLYRQRIVGIARGVRRPGPSRSVATGLALATAPALVIGALAGESIKAHLLEPVPVALAWMSGGGLILGVAAWYRRREIVWGRPLDSLDTRTALLIGAAQVLALWPGVSRSLVTILAGVALGLSVAAAVEFSFLMGVIVLTAATAYELLLGDSTLSLGDGSVVVGLLVAFATATIAVRWLVSYLEHRDLSLFGWYRMAIGGVTLALVASGVLHT